MKRRLDQLVYDRGLVASRSQAESRIRLGDVRVNGRIIAKPGYFANEEDVVEFVSKETYVSRAALKLASVARQLNVRFDGAIVLDVGSSTGGFTDYALQHGAKLVIAVDVGTNQLHPSLRDNPNIELHEQTDIRDIKTLRATPDIVVIDVSFISLRQILPHIARLANDHTQIVAMVKPQFEAVAQHVKHKGVIKNDRLRRDVLKSFELWAKQFFIIVDKADSAVAGTKGNVERFYMLRLVKGTPVSPVV